MRKLSIVFSVLFLLAGTAGLAGAAIIDFAGGTAYLAGGSSVVTDNDTTYSNVDYYEEDGFRLDFVGATGIIGNYYGADTTGNNNAVIHGHWDTGHYGTLTSIVVTKIDGTAFDLNYFILTSNTDSGGGYASGLEQASITASNGYSLTLPAQDWGWYTTGPYPGATGLGADQIFLDSNFDNITSFTFTVANVVDCFGMDSFYIDEEAPPIIDPVPEPATLFLLGSGLVGFIGASRKKARK